MVSLGFARLSFVWHFPCREVRLTPEVLAQRDVSSGVHMRRTGDVSSHTLTVLSVTLGAPASQHQHSHGGLTYWSQSNVFLLNGKRKRLALIGHNHLTVVSDVSPQPAPSLHGPADRPPLVLSSPAGLQLQVWLLVIPPLPLVTMFYCRAREGLKTLRVEDDRPALNVGLIVPFSNFLKKQYEKSVGAAVSGIKKKSYSWSYIYNLDEYTIHTEMMSINPSPTGCFIAILA